MNAPRVVAGVVETIGPGLVRLTLDTDPDTGLTTTVEAVVPPLIDGQVAYALVGDHGAVVLATGAASIRVEFATYADLRDGIVVG